MRLLTKNDLVNCKSERAYREVVLPSPDSDKMPGSVTVRIRKMFAAEWIAFRDSLTDDQGRPIKGRMDRSGELQVAFCWVDEAGARVMADGDIDADWWKRRDPAFVSRFVDEVRDFNLAGFAALADERKNSAATDGSGSPIALPPDSESQTQAA